jgi:anaerobic selenocysteine-containing dehydrogenase
MDGSSFAEVHGKGKDVARDTVCYMCGSGCPTRVYIRDGKAIRIEHTDPRMKICPRWKATLDFVYHPDRLKYPLKLVGTRGKGAFKRISWNEALNTIAANLRSIAGMYGPESTVFYISEAKEYLQYYHRLAHAFGSPNFCTGTSNCFTATLLAATLTYGEDYGQLIEQNDTFTDPLTKCKVVWGSGIIHSSPRLWKEYLAAKQNGLKVIVIDPMRTKIASMADIHLQLRPGTDGALALSLINVIINEHLCDLDFIEKWTIGFDSLRVLVEEYSPGIAENITGVPAEKIRSAAILYATQKPANLIVSPVATTHCSNGVQNHRAIILLPALTGNLDIEGGNHGSPAPIPLNNVTLQELIESLPPGIGANRFPIWTGLRKEMQANTLAERIDSGSPYPIKALFGGGLNILFFPNTNRLIKSIQSLEFIAVTEYFHNTATQYADIVLPIASWLERPLLITNPALLSNKERRIRLIEPALEPPGECWPEWKIIFELAGRLGLSDQFWDGDFKKSLNFLLEPSGITMEDLGRCPEGIEYSGPIPFQKYYERGGFQTPSGKIEFASSILPRFGHESLPVYREPFESPVSRPDLLKRFPLVLTTGARTLAFTHSQYRNIPQLRKIMPEPLLQINPVDANPRNIISGNAVTVSSLRGTIKLKAEVTDIIMPGAVHIPHHWPGEANVNSLIDDRDLDPISGFAPFKSQLCQVNKHNSESYPNEVI